MAESKEDILARVRADFEKVHGKGSMTRLDKPEVLSTVTDWVSTRSIVVDSVLRGESSRPFEEQPLLPFGRQVELSGLEKAGKTTLCGHIAAEVQAQGGLVYAVDTEERYQREYWKTLGVNLNEVEIIKANSVAEVFNKQYTILKSLEGTDIKVLMLWDSLGGTSIADKIDPKSKETPMEQVASAYGRNAGEISRGMLMINSVIASTKACYLYTNHMYHKMNTSPWEEKYETYGGQKLKYFATIRLRLTRGKAVKEADAVSVADKVIGTYVRIKALKNSQAPYELEREAVLIGDKGFNNDYTVFEYGKKLGVITSKGAWSTWNTPLGEEVKFQGFRGFLEKVTTHSEYQELYNEVERSL